MPRVQVLDGKGLQSAVRALQLQVVLWYPSLQARTADMPQPWQGAITLYPDVDGTLFLEAHDGTRWVRLNGTGSSGGGGVTDHGLLSGLTDDDHPQYLTDAEGDALFLKPAEVLAGSNVTVDRTTTPGSVIVSAAGGGTASSEVEIGAADPIGANPATELWFDTDAVPSTTYLTNAQVDAKIANTAWGIVAKGAFTVPAGTVVTPTAVALTNTISYTTVVNRRYRLVMQIRAIAPSTTGTSLRVAFESAPTSSFPLADAYAWAGGAYAILRAEVIFTGTGVLTVYSALFNSTSALNVIVHPDLQTSNWYLEDIGPVR